jgi:hypothetical protein
MAEKEGKRNDFFTTQDKKQSIIPPLERKILGYGIYSTYTLHGAIEHPFAACWQLEGILEEPILMSL